MQTVLDLELPMRKVKVNKAELLETIRKNRAQHIEDYKEACAGYKEAALEKIENVFQDLKGRIDRLKEGQVIALMGVSFGLEVPHSYEKVYDQVIRMLEMSIEDTVELETSEFACYVMDDWDWKDRFTNQTVMYSNFTKSR